MDRTEGNSPAGHGVFDVAMELFIRRLNNESPNINGIRSQITTEFVPVPTSDHVAGIVGHGGCRIQAIRGKTNAFIMSPYRGENPIFIVAGQKQEVAAAKREILSAADHMTQIIAHQNNINGSSIPGMNIIPGQTTVQVRVPYPIVGLIVGHKGETIKRIQHQTNTVIVSPVRGEEPIFKITGMPVCVTHARNLIERHITMRTGLL